MTGSVRRAFTVASRIPLFQIFVLLYQPLCIMGRNADGDARRIGTGLITSTDCLLDRATEMVHHLIVDQEIIFGRERLAFTTSATTVAARSTVVITVLPASGTIIHRIGSAVSPISIGILTTSSTFGTRTEPTGFPFTTIASGTAGAATTTATTGTTGAYIVGFAAEATATAAATGTDGMVPSRASMEMSGSSATSSTVVRGCRSSFGIHMKVTALVDIEITHGTGCFSTTTILSSDTIKVSFCERSYFSSANTRTTGTTVASTCADASTGTTTAVTTGTTVTRVYPFTVRIIS